MLILKEKIGDHGIYNFNENNYGFLDFFKDLYKEDNLEDLHLKSEEYNKYKDRLCLGILNDTDSDLHKKFYEAIKLDNKFKEKYCTLIKDIYKQFFPEEKHIIYQSYPSIRIQYPESVTIPPHKDSDHLSNHPLGEKNFLIPITEMKNTNTIIIESEPDKKDFKSINLKPGEIFYFNGNTCTHYNENNKEGKLRISIDFRIILEKDYITYRTNKNDNRKLLSVKS